MRANTSKRRNGSVSVLACIEEGEEEDAASLRRERRSELMMEWRGIVWMLVHGCVMMGFWL
jgi:hypothetical protein